MPPQRAQALSRLRAFRCTHRRSRLGLDTAEHAATIGEPEPTPNPHWHHQLTAFNSPHPPSPTPWLTR
jgi:hypothetical protein